MKKLEENTVGYRIRRARELAGIKQKELAGGLGVTAVYLGMVERGDRMPSSVLLNKIADLTGKSYLWLLNGMEENESSFSEQIEKDPMWRDVDMRLLLVLLNAYDSEDELSKILNISAETIDKCINLGEDVPFNRAWETILPALVKKINMPLLYSQFQRIYEVWHNNHERDLCNIAMYAVERVVFGTWGEATTLVEDGEWYFKSNDKRNVQATYKIYQKEEPPYSNWVCIHISNVPKGLRDANDIIKSLGSMITTRREGDEISFVFTDWDEFNMYCPIIDASLKSTNSTNNVHCRISVMYADNDTRKIENIY